LLAHEGGQLLLGEWWWTWRCCASRSC
jgi:hypothetical protein